MPLRRCFRSEWRDCVRTIVAHSVSPHTERQQSAHRPLVQHIVSAELSADSLCSRRVARMDFGVSSAAARPLLDASVYVVQCALVCIPLLKHTSHIITTLQKRVRFLFTRSVSDSVFFCVCLHCINNNITLCDCACALDSVCRGGRVQQLPTHPFLSYYIGIPQAGRSLMHRE